MLARRIFAKRTIINLNNCEYTQISNYARWAHRRPVRVLTQEQYENDERSPPEHVNNVQPESDLANRDVPQTKWRYSAQNKFEELSTVQKNSKPKKEYRPLKPTNSTFDMLETIIDANGNIIYTKMANHDPRISRIMTTVKVKNERNRKNVILLEGKRLIKEALESSCKLKYLLFSRKDDLEDLKSLLPKSGGHIYKMPLKEMQLWSDLTQCPGIMGIFEHPVVENFISPDNSVPITVICDNIREPGNLGSILRICAGVGCHHVFLTKGCVNLWDTKVTRSGCGAHFRLQIHTKLEWADVKERIHLGSRVFVADNNTFNSSSARGESVLSIIDQVPLLPYYSVPFNKEDHVVLIIGGETEGLSEEAYNIVLESNGGRLNIPLYNGIDSLNASVAAGIILFEIRKQMLMARIDKSVLSCTS